MMDRKEAADLLDNLIGMVEDNHGEDYDTALKMGIEALSSANGDMISRQAAIDALHMHLMYRMGTDSNKKRLDDWINGVPSAQPERKKDIIQTFHDYQIEWLTNHCDIELEPQLEELIVRFLHDTANMYMLEMERRTDETAI